MQGPSQELIIKSEVLSKNISFESTDAKENVDVRI